MIFGTILKNMINIFNNKRARLIKINNGGMNPKNNPTHDVIPQLNNFYKRPADFDAPWVLILCS